MRIPFISNSVREWDCINALVCALVSKFKEEGESLYITKLLKLLFYFDFLSVKCNEKSFTGDVYFKMPYGPVPSIIKDQLDLLKEGNQENEEISEYELKSAFSEYLTAERDSHTKGYILKVRENAQVTGLAGHLSEWDTALIEELVKSFKGVSVKDIVDQTHRETPYTKTTKMEILSYLLADDKSFPKANITVPS